MSDFGKTRRKIAPVALSLGILISQTGCVISRGHYHGSRTDEAVEVMAQIAIIAGYVALQCADFCGRCCCH